METRYAESIPAPGERQGVGGAVHAAGIAALVTAAALAVMLAVKPIGSYDVGYHLAYGDYFLDNGEIVQTNRFTWAPLGEEIPVDRAQWGPGCHFDQETNTYHFINANWLTQIIFSAVHRYAGGITGLCVLQALLVAGMFSLIIVTSRRGGVGWHWLGAGVLLVALTSYERFSLRPEVLGSLVLLGQWTMLAGPGFGPKRAIGVAPLQVLAVNLHSYFLLGIVLTGLVFADSFVRWIWAREVARKPDASLTRRGKWLAVAAVGVIVASFVNPWFFRGLIMPIQAAWFLKKHHIAGAIPQRGGIHPWATIGELLSPFDRTYSHTLSTKAFVVVLTLVPLTAVVVVLRRRWGQLLVLIAVTIVSTQLRRNMAYAAMILVPLSLAALTDAWRWLAHRTRNARLHSAERIVRAVVSITVLAAGLWLIVSVATQRFYFSERQSWRFGHGLSRHSVPVDAAEWIRQHRPAGKVFCDFDSSSNLLYFAGSAVQEVPILTNTWATPVTAMQWGMQIPAGLRDFEAMADKHGVNTVVLRSAKVSEPLTAHLANSTRWAVTHVGGKFLIFIRRDGPNSALAERAAITKDSFNVRQYIRRVSETDPVGAFALHNAAMTLRRMRWGNHAISVWRECVKAEPRYWEALAELGRTLALRGQAKRMLMEAYLSKQMLRQAKKTWREALANYLDAEKKLARTLRIKPDHEAARINLDTVRDQIARLRRLGKQLRWEG